MTLYTGALEAMAQLWVLRLLLAKKSFWVYDFFLPGSLRNIVIIDVAQAPH
jgi:hypothetical protein